MSRISCLFQLSADEEKDIQARFFSVEPMMCVCQYFGLILKEDGHAQLIGQPHDQAENWKPFRAEDWTGVVKLYKSDSHIVGLKQDGTVIACGQNDKNQCETGDWRDIREVYVSEEATVGVDQNGTTHYTYTFRSPFPPAQPAPAATTPKTNVQAAQTSQANIPAEQPSIETTDEKFFRYKTNHDGTVTITGYKGEEKNVIIPSTIEGKSVTSIGAWAFSRCVNLICINLPDSVTSIGVGAFIHCGSLTSVTIPDGVTSIGESAFYKCESLTSITFPDSVTSIGKDAFFDCKNLTAVVLPADGANIGKDAFFGCDHLTIYGNPSGYAESYAKENGIPFKTK